MPKWDARKPAKNRTTKGMISRVALCLLGCALIFPGSLQACFIVGDLNGDCQVGMDDLAWMASQWMTPSSCGSETGLILHWKLDETSGNAIDSSESGYDGIVDGANWNPLGGALQFDGVDDYVSTSYQGISGSNPRTCAAWIKTDQSPGQIMTWGNLSVAANGWVIGVDEAGVLRVDVGGGVIFGTTVLTDDFWHHIAVTSDGSTTDQIALYVDGKIETVSEVVLQSINTASAASVMLGKCPGTESFFNGLIDDARIYDRVLSLQEIWSIAKTGTTDYACADMNMDQTVNLTDLAKMSQDWNDASPIVSINEFLADNESKSPLGPGDILDGNFESSDWIELHNNSEMIIDIGRWYLTDESGLKTKWQFPTSTILQPGDYLIVFASGKTQELYPGNYPYVDPAGYLHTNFQLSNNGEYLGLFAADGTTPIHEYNHFELGGQYGYPAQETDISYGYYYDEERYFSVPTPAADNIKSSFEEFVEKPDVNIKGGCYQAAVDVTLSCGTDGAFIQYTTDGTVPSLTNGSHYTGPIHIDSITTILAKAFKSGLQPSDTRIETYIFVDSSVASFNSNLPIIVIDTLGVAIPNDKTSIHCRAVIVDTDSNTTRAEITGTEHFEGWGTIRKRGETTFTGRFQYAFEVQDEYGDDKDVPLLGMPAESDWIITSEPLDYTLLKAHIAYKWFRDMGHYATRDRFVEMYLNTGGGNISTGNYLGIFILREKIKRSDNRVDISRLDASHNLEPKVSGGYIVKNDKADTGDMVIVLDGITPNADRPTTIVEPDPLEITQPQIDWIVNYINEFHSILWQDTSSSHYPGPEAKYSDYIDVFSWIDHGLVEQIANDADAFLISYFTHKDRGGKICSGPPWDFDRGFHNNVGTIRPYDVWGAGSAIFGKWHTELQKDSEYKLKLADRWFQHREEVLNTDATMAYLDETVALITEAMDRTIAAYGFSVNAQGATYEDEVDNYFKPWILNRLNWLDVYIANNFAEKPPVFSFAGGYIGPGDILEMDLPPFKSGDIYYTLNGEDPRTEGGGINPNAEFYPDPGGIVLEFEDFEGGMGNWINADADPNNWYRRSGTTPTNYTGPDSGAGESTWYMYMEASVSNDNGDTVILEGPTVEGTGLKLSFFYHMYGWDMGTLNVDVDESSDGSWTNGVWSKSGQQHSSATSAYTQAIVDLSSYATPLKVRFRGVAAGGSRGDMAIDHIKITKPSGERITTESLVEMSSSVWKYLYDGSDQGAAWRTSGFDDNAWSSGPGQLGFGDDDETTDIGPKVNGPRTAYFRHKFNVTNASGITDVSIDLLYDDGAVVYINDHEVGRIHMPTGTIYYDTLSDGSGGDNATTTFPDIDPSFLIEGGNILAVEVHQDKDTSSDISFDLKLETTKTFSGFDKSTCVKARFLNGSDWSAMNTEVYALSDVLENLRISEMMYHPADPTSAEMTTTGNPDLTDEDFEYIELQNIGSTAINLNLVHFTDGIDFTFGNYILAAGDHAVLVKNQAAFAARYDTAGINIVPGNYIGSLDNDGEEIVLRDAIGTEIHDFDYNDGWYELTDGLGYSLTMVDPASADPNLWDSKAGWRSSLYVGGTPGRASETVLAMDSIVVNEVLSHSHGLEPDWIELYNTTAQDINISGWFLSDDDSDPNLIKKYQIPDNTVISAGDYHVFVGDVSFDDPTPDVGNIPFGLSEGGETVYLYSGSGGEVTGLYQTQQTFDAAETDVTFGRYEKAELSGGYDFVRQSSPSKNGANNGPLIPDIVITEIYYNPPLGADYEFVELYNRSGSAVTLETSVTTETSPGVFKTEDIPWRLEGTGYEFPADANAVTIPSHSYIQVAKNSEMYSSAPCPVYGPYDGKLDNGGEELEIQMPGDQEYGKSRFWIPIEKVDYDDVAPWPTSPDGGGDSLHRSNFNAYGRDYSNWNAAAPTPGS